MLPIKMAKKRKFFKKSLKNGPDGRKTREKTRKKYTSAQGTRAQVLSLKSTRHKLKKHAFY